MDPEFASRDLSNGEFKTPLEYKSKAFNRTCRNLGLRHIRTEPYAPKTNGKAERFIQTALRE